MVLAGPAGAEGLLGEAVFVPSGRPAAAGHVRVRVRGGLAVQAGIERDGTFRLALSEAVEEGDLAADLVTASGLPPIAAHATFQRAPNGTRRLRLAMRDGWFLRGRLRTPEGRAPEERTVAAVTEGNIDPADAAEAAALSEGGPESPRPEELVNFGAFRPLAVGADGRFGPAWVTAAEAYLVVARSAARWAEWRSAAPDHVPPGGLWDAGDLPFPAATGVSLTVDAGADAYPGLRVKPIRVPTSRAGDTLYLRLRAVDPLLAEAIYGEGALPVEPGRALRLSPLPPDAAVDLALRAPSGLLSEPLRVPLRPGETLPVRLEVAALFSPSRYAGATLTGQLVWSGSGEPIAGAAVAAVRAGAPDAGRAARSDAQGRFRLEGLAWDEEHTFRIAWDDGGHERTVLRTASFPEGAGDPQLVWEIPPRLFLRARALVPPSTRTEETGPMGFALEHRNAEGLWAPAAADVYEPAPDGVDVSVDQPGTYRVVALWSPLVVTRTAATRVADLGAEAEFERPGPRVVLGGIVLSRSGAPQPRALVRALGPSGGLPPVEVTADERGRFEIGAVNVEEVTLFVRADAGAAEVVLREGQIGPLVLVTVE